MNMTTQCKACIIVSSQTLTDDLLVHYEAADNAFIAAAEGEAVASEDDVERFCGM